MERYRRGQRRLCSQPERESAPAVTSQRADIQSNIWIFVPSAKPECVQAQSWGVEGVVTQLPGQLRSLSGITAHRPGSNSGAGVIWRGEERGKGSNNIIKLTRPEHPTVIKRAAHGQAAVASPNAGPHVQTCGDALIPALQRVASYSKINMNYGASGSWRRMSCKAETNVTWGASGQFFFFFF